MIIFMSIQHQRNNENQPDIKVDVELDVIGMKCPLPVLKARRQINNMTANSVLKVLADDPAASLDFEHFCSTGGHKLLSATEKSGIFIFYVVVLAG